MTSVAIGHWTKLGSTVRDARTGRGWSQHELARRAQVSRSWLARLESGHRGAELEQILRLLAALELTLSVSDGAPSTDSDQQLSGPSDERASLRESAQALVAAHESVNAARRASWSLVPEESLGD